MQQETEQQKALRDFGYEVAKALGIIWLVQKIPFLVLKDWVQERHERPSNNR